MNQKKKVLNWLYLVIALIAFSVSLFKWDNQVWIAAWIAPAVLMRLMRQNKWDWAVFQGFAVLLIAYIIGTYPVFESMNGESGGENSAFILILNLIMACLVALLFLIPFLFDKAFHKKLPKLAGSLIFPAGITSMELLSSYVQGTLFCFGQSQAVLQPLVMISSIIGMLGLSFLIAWFASMVNNLWEEALDFKKLVYSGLVYIAVMAVLLIYGAVSIVYPAKAEKTVTIAGITMDTHYDERLLSVDFELFDKKPEEYVNKLSIDAHFPHYIRQAAVKQIDLLLDPSIDGKVYTPLHTFNGGFRAVENGFTLFRVVGEGYSAVYDPYYRLWAGQNSFEQGKENFYSDVPVISRKTFYGNIGFIFPYITVLLLISLIVSAIIRKHEEFINARIR